MPGTIWRRDTPLFLFISRSFVSLFSAQRRRRRRLLYSSPPPPPPPPKFRITRHPRIALRRPCVWKVWLEYWFRGMSRCVGGATRRTTDSVIYDSVAALYLSLFNGPSILRFFVRTRDSIHARIRALNLVFLTFCFLPFTRGSAVPTVSRIDWELWRNFTGKQQ